MLVEQLGSSFQKFTLGHFGLVSTKSDKKNVKSMAKKLSKEYLPDWIYDHFAQDDGRPACVVTGEFEEITKNMTFIGLWCIQVVPKF